MTTETTTPPTTDPLADAQAWLRELDGSDSGEVLLRAADVVERDPGRVARFLRAVAARVTGGAT